MKVQMQVKVQVQVHVQMQAKVQVQVKVQIQKQVHVQVQFVLSTCWSCALSGRIGKVVASHAEVARSIPAEAAPIYTMHKALSGYCP